MKKFLFLLFIIIFVPLDSTSRCTSGFITIKAKLMDINEKPLKDVNGFGFINNSENIYYDKFYFENEKYGEPLDIYDENIYAKTDKDGNIIIKLFFNTWSMPEEIMNPHCNERIRRIDLFFFKEGYLPLRKVLLQVKDNIITDFPLEKVKIDIGTIKMKKIKSQKEIDEIIWKNE